MTLDNKSLETVITKACDTHLAFVESQCTQEHMFSERFEEKIKTVKEKKRHLWSMERIQIAAVLAVVLTIAAIAARILPNWNRTVNIGVESTAVIETSVANLELTTDEPFTEDRTISLAEVAVIPEGYQMTVTEETDVIWYSFDNGTEQIRLEQRLNEGDWLDYIVKLAEDAARERENVKFIPMHGEGGYQDLTEDGFDFWWSSGKYAFHLTTVGSQEDAMAIANGIRTFEW